MTVVDDRHQSEFPRPKTQDPIPNKVLNFENFKNFEYLLEIGIWKLELK